MFVLKRKIVLCRLKLELTTWRLYLTKKPHLRLFFFRQILEVTSTFRIRVCCFERNEQIMHKRSYKYVQKLLIYLHSIKNAHKVWTLYSRFTFLFRLFICFLTAYLWIFNSSSFIVHLVLKTKTLNYSPYLNSVLKCSKLNFNFIYIYTNTLNLKLKAQFGVYQK